jgi:hypothetical protein
LKAYFRAHDDSAPHAFALNIAVSVWFCRCPHIDGRWARRRVSSMRAPQSAPPSDTLRSEEITMRPQRSLTERTIATIDSWLPMDGPKLALLTLVVTGVLAVSLFVH